MSPATPIIQKNNSISAIWILPLIALAICGWLLFSSYRDAGILITVYFEDANGITPGKTQVISKGIPIGLVQETHPDLDNKRVRLVVKMEKESEKYLVKDTLFWVVRPELSAARIQGLETIFTGSYIGIQVGSSDLDSREFTGLATVPPIPEDAPGLHISLHAEALGSIQVGTGIYYRNIEIGSVQGYRLQDDNSVLISLYIEDKYANIVRQGSRFSNASGISISGKLTNLKIQVESLASLLKGGILLQTPEQLKDGPPVQNGHVFPLYKDLEEANYGILMTLNLASAIDIVEGDTKVMYRGIEAGFVKEIQINKDDRRTVTAHILLDPRAELILREKTQFWLVKPEITPSGVSNLRTLLAGPHITFKPGEGSFRDHFEILPAPPPDEPLRPGTTFVLTTDNAVSFSPQSPVFYKKIQVGEVISIDLDSTGKKVSTSLFIYQPYLRLLNRNSVFWQQSGVEAQANLSGVQIRTGPLAEMFHGSISFATPDLGPTNKQPITTTQRFPLYGSYAEAVQAVPALQEPGLHIRLRAADAGSLSVDSPLLHKNLPIGKVVGFQLSTDRQEVFIDCFINRKYTDLVRTPSRFYTLSGVEISGGLEGLTMKTGSLQSMVSGGIGILPSTGGDMPRGTGTYPLYKDLQDALHADDMAIHVTFAEAVGQLKKGSPVKYRGVNIGSVTELSFGNDLQSLVAGLRIDRKFSSLFRSETKIWLEKPQLSISGINNPETVLFGPYITFSPGKGSLRQDFMALGNPPRYPTPQGKGLHIILETLHLGSLSPGSPVSYRQVPIGQVTGFTLSPTFQKVYVAVTIDPPYQHVIRENSRFWNASGAKFEAG
ncbi:MAG: MlaD family protein, partial [Desulfoprunum sp.]|nr:MlaD family protein [Desulfoprunum sp.]